MQPLTGQLAGLFGRRHVALVTVALYTLGSGLCGGASGPAMLIAGRAVQGAGSGGMTAIMSIVISDLVPLRMRSNYIAILAVTYAFGMAIGPVVGGAIVQNTSWRWVGTHFHPDSCTESELTDELLTSRCFISTSLLVASLSPFYGYSYVSNGTSKPIYGINSGGLMSSATAC